MDPNKGISSTTRLKTLISNNVRMKNNGEKYT